MESVSKDAVPGRKSHRLWFIVATALLLVTLAASIGGYWLRTPAKRLRGENFGSIQPGMTQKQVEDLLGGPPGNYGHASGRAVMSAEGALLASACREEDWYDDDQRFEVFFNGAGKVRGTHKRAGYHQSPVTIANLLDWLRSRLKL
jgi:hypothetical protein